MPGSHPFKLELRCRTCGVLCYRDDQGRWVHESAVPRGHEPNLLWFGRKQRKRASAIPADAPSEPAGHDEAVD